MKIIRVALIFLVFSTFVFTTNGFAKDTNSNSKAKISYSANKTIDNNIETKLIGNAKVSIDNLIIQGQELTIIKNQKNKVKSYTFIADNISSSKNKKNSTLKGNAKIKFKDFTVTGKNLKVYLVKS